MSQPTNPPTETTPPASGSETPPAAPAQADITKLALSRLGYLVSDELPPEPPVEPPVTPPVEPPAAPAEGAPAATPPAEPAPAGQVTGDVTPPAAPTVPPEATPRVKKRTPAPPAPTAAEIAKEFAKELRQQPSPPPVVTPPAVTEPELPDFDREELELAKFAAEAMPDKYRGFDQKMLGFFKKRDDEIRAIIAEDGEFDPQGERYQKFIREQRPAFQGADRQKVIREQIRREARAESEKLVAQERQRYETDIRRLEHTPAVLREVQATQEAVLGVDDEAVKTYKADPVKTQEENPIEAPIIQGIVQDTAAMTEEYLKIARGIVEPTEKNEVHVALSKFINHQGKLLDAMPEEQRTGKDGRVFVSRETYAQMKEKKDPQLDSYRTIDDQLVVGMIREFGKQTLQTRLKETRTRLEKAGFKRAPATPPPAPAPTGAPAAPAAPPPVASSAPKGTVAPSAPPPQKPAAKTVNPLFKSLGITDPEG